MPETPVSRFRINQRAKDRIARIRDLTGKSDAEILQDAVAHMLSSLEQEQPINLIVPSERKEGRRPPRDAA